MSDPKDPSDGDDAESAWFSGEEPTPEAPPSSLPPPPPEAHEPTVFAPRGAADAGPGWGASPMPPPQAESPPPPAPPPGSGNRDGGRLAPGEVLNGIYEIKRFLARGGMGEVYEGFNVNNPDERVAIKVILASLADDDDVRRMFQKEARTLSQLTQVHHPAIVQYRLLGPFYIVTEFIDGVQLVDVLRTLKPTENDLIAFTRRMAEGLKAAHAAGVLHRDIAPDNILLPGGGLASAKIIDFGIARDGNAPGGTIIGDGFAGKLGFVAPEQLGDYGREVGDWTDIYSLGLVVLALAKGRPVDMGVTVVDAVDRRRAGPDTSEAPPNLRRVLDRMLAANPKDRFRSMAELIAALDSPQPGGKGAKPNPAKAPGAPAGPGGIKLPVKLSMPVLASIGGGVALLVAAFVVAMLIAPKRDPALDQAAKAAATAPSQPPAMVAERALAKVQCGWLEVVDLSRGEGGLSVTLTGSAGDPATAAESVSRALVAARHPVARIDTSGVVRLDPGACVVIDALRSVRMPPAQVQLPWVSVGPTSVSLPTFHLLPDTGKCKISPVAAIPIALQTGEMPGEPTLLGMRPDGAMQPLISGRAELEEWTAKEASFQKLRPDGADLMVCDDKAVISGFVVISGPNVASLGLAKNVENRPGADFSARFGELARANGWRTQMTWYQVVGGAPSAPAAPGAIPPPAGAPARP